MCVIVNVSITFEHVCVCMSAWYERACVSVFICVCVRVHVCVRVCVWGNIHMCVSVCA